MEGEQESSLEYTATWIVAVVCSIIVLLSLIAERGLHRLGKLLLHKDQHALHEALQKLKDELMLLGFISLLLTVFQSLISLICIPTDLASFMLPCKRQESVSSNGSEHYLNNRRRLLSEHTGSGHCKREGETPLLSLEALHQLHIFIFVLAVVHVIFCVTTMFLGGARIRQWRKWESSKSLKEPKKSNSTTSRDHHDRFIEQRALGYWRKAAVLSWMISFFKQFYGSITKSDYAVLRQGFIKEHFPNNDKVNFHKYIMSTLEVDFKKVVGISWHLWLFVVIFLLLNVAGWHSYFWLSFLPLIMLLLVGAKLEHIITRFAHEVAERKASNADGHEAARVKVSDEHFWFHRPGIVLHLIHFILFQNSFEIAFFIWILSTYGFNSCIMEKMGYIVTRLIMGVLVQVLCSYSTMPLYAIVTMMGSKFKEGFFKEDMHSTLVNWARKTRGKERSAGSHPTHANQTQMQSPHNVQIEEQAMVVIEETSTQITELP